MLSSFLQTTLWAEFKGRHGWVPHYFSLEKETFLLPTKQKEGALIVLVRSFSLKIKRFSLAYIPMAPEPLCNIESATTKEKTQYLESLEDMAKSLKPHLPKNTLFVRFDPPLSFTSLDEATAFANFVAQQKGNILRLKKSSVNVQPPDTVLLNLEKTEDEILSAMKSKWRYNVKLAAKKGVTVTAHYGNNADFNAKFEAFYTLFMQTSERDKVSFHSKDYYIDLLKHGAISKEEQSELTVTLYLAWHEDAPLAGIITLFTKNEAVYLYGASGNIKRNLMPAYLLQWTAIKDAKAHGCKVYDFYGIPPTDDEKHPMHGLYLFKTGFGGTIIHRPGSFDVPLKKTYTLYEGAERLRAWWHKSVLKHFRKAHS